MMLIGGYVELIILKEELTNIYAVISSEEQVAGKYLLQQ